MGGVGGGFPQKEGLSWTLKEGGVWGEQAVSRWERLSEQRPKAVSVGVV